MNEEYWKSCYDILSEKVSAFLKAQLTVRQQSWNHKAKVDLFEKEKELNKIVNPERSVKPVQLKWREQ